MGQRESGSATRILTVFQKHERAREHFDESHFVPRQFGCAETRVCTNFRRAHFLRVGRSSERIDPPQQLGSAATKDPS
jgi:hypothetical protein